MHATATANVHPLSKAAYDRIRPYLFRLDVALIVSALMEAPGGLTQGELAFTTWLRTQSASARCVELKASGIVEELKIDGEPATRPTRSGFSVAVLLLAEDAMEKITEAAALREARREERAALRDTITVSVKAVLRPRDGAGSELEAL
jgi:hypothetical protein